MMSESEETYYGVEEDTGLQSERRLQMYGERGLYSQGKGGIHPCISRALSGRHILILGTTGSGKTYAAAYMAQKTDCFVFVNSGEEREVSTICQVSLDDPSEVGEALEEGYRRIEFVPSMDRAQARDELQSLREGLFEIGSEMKTQTKELELPFWITVFLDELQLFAPLLSHLDAENFFTRGRGYGIKSVAITRQPQELSKEVVNDCEYQLFFEFGDYAMPYFTRFKIPIEQHRMWVKQEHHFLLYRRGEFTECYPV